MDSVEIPVIRISLSKEDIVKTYPSIDIKTIRFLLYPYERFKIGLAFSKNATQVKTADLMLDLVYGNVIPLRASILLEYPDIPEDTILVTRRISKEESINLAKEAAFRIGARYLRLPKEYEVIMSEEVYRPFWVAAYDNKGKVDFRVVDANTGQHDPSLRDYFLDSLKGKL